jgi:N-acetylglucosaminyl-diphospho-decaprenol L-rhamnosyltransferase
MSDAIVVTYRSADVIGPCLSSLLEAGLDVIVVDNADTADVVRERFPAVSLIVNDTNRGFAAAVNQGLERSGGNIVLLVNPDCVVPPRTADALIAHLRAHPDVAVAGPRLRGPDGRLAVSAHPFPTFTTLLASALFPRAQSTLPRVFTRLLARLPGWSSYGASLHATEPADVPWLTGACLAVRGPFLRDELGGLDEGYFMYYEDMELCLQAWNRGQRVVYLPDVEAQHVGGASTGHRGEMGVIHTRSTLRFHARNRPQTYELVRLVLLLRALIGLAAAVGHDLRRSDARRRSAWLDVIRLTMAASKHTLRS